MKLRECAWGAAPRPPPEGRPRDSIRSRPSFACRLAVGGPRSLVGSLGLSPPTNIMSSGPHDTTVNGVLVRYKIYAEKNRKPKIKFCVGFDVQDPMPEREWEQLRSDGNAEAVVQEAAQKLLGNGRSSAGGGEAGPSQPIGPREQASLQELNSAADGPAMEFGFGIERLGTFEQFLKLCPVRRIIPSPALLRARLLR
jgi:hypothetical protein